MRAGARRGYAGSSPETMRCRCRRDERTSVSQSHAAPSASPGSDRRLPRARRTRWAGVLESDQGTARRARRRPAAARQPPAGSQPAGGGGRARYREDGAPGGDRLRRPLARSQRAALQPQPRGGAAVPRGAHRAARRDRAGPDRRSAPAAALGDANRAALGRAGRVGGRAADGCRGPRHDPQAGRRGRAGARRGGRPHLGRRRVDACTRVRPPAAGGAPRRGPRHRPHRRGRAPASARAFGRSGARGPARARAIGCRAPARRAVRAPRREHLPNGSRAGSTAAPAATRSTRSRSAGRC